MFLKTLQANTTNTYAAFARDRKFSSLQEFEERAAVFKTNLELIQELNNNLSDFFVSP